MFSRNEYFKNMLQNMESTFDSLFPLGVIIVAFVGLARSFLSPGDSFIYFDLATVVFLGIIYIGRSYIDIRIKTMIVTCALTFTGLVSFYYYGLTGTGMPVLIISNIVAIIFNTKEQFRINFVISVVGLLAIVFYMDSIQHDIAFNGNYYFNIAIYMLMIQVIKISLVSIKVYLLNNIEALDRNIRENEIMISELAIQNAAIRTNEKEIYNLAFFDQLTGLPKRNLFEKHVSERMKITDEGILMVIDVKEFKLLNSIYGTEVGDQILTLCGKILKNNIADIYACRLNGNEFGLWIEHHDIEFVRRALATLETHFIEETKGIFQYNKIKFHVGYVEYPKDGIEYSELIDKLLLALNYGKTNTATGYVKYESYMEEKLIYENNLKRLIEEAINTQAFQVFYQEKYDSQSCQVIGLEALARWHSDLLGDVSPNEFIPMIVKHNMIESFERIIIEKVFKDYPKLISKYGAINIGINISPDHIMKHYFVEYMERAANTLNVNKSHIVIEITEEVMIKGIKNVEGILTSLRNMGFKISLDDFGSGYSSLNYLARLPFDEIKIDKAFVDEIHNEKVRKVLRTIIELKMIYDVDVIAEGVEHQSQLDDLQSIGCYMIQGYLYSRPKALK